LSKAYQEVVRAVFLSSTSSPSGANKKKSMKDLQEEVTNLCNNIRLFEKGAKFFSGRRTKIFSGRGTNIFSGRGAELFSGRGTKFFSGTRTKMQEDG